MHYSQYTVNRETARMRRTLGALVELDTLDELDTLGADVDEPLVELVDATLEMLDDTLEMLDELEDYRDIRAEAYLDELDTLERMSLCFGRVS